MDVTGIWFWFWAVAAVVLFIGEIFTAGFFLLPFGIGATVAAILAFLQVSVAWQWAAFIAVSTAAFLSMRRFSDRLTHEPPVKTGSDRLIGRTGVVTQALIPNDMAGQARIDGEIWRADAPDHGVVAEGARVIVDRIEGTHLVVHPEIQALADDAEDG